MSYSGNGLRGASMPQEGYGLTNRVKSPTAKAAQDSAAEAAEFQLWVSKQGTSLSKLKVFHTMAKQVNDQN